MLTKEDILLKSTNYNDLMLQHVIIFNYLRCSLLSPGLSCISYDRSNDVKIKFHKFQAVFRYSETSCGKNGPKGLSKVLYTDLECG